MKRRIELIVLVMLMAVSAAADFPTISTTPLNESGGFISGAAQGPDGAIWFTDGDKNVIGRVPIGGSVTTYPIPTASSGVSKITAGPDGNMWFIENSKVGKITMSGTITEYSLTGISFPSSIASGPDGNLWIVGINGPKTLLARIATSGSIAGTTQLPGSSPSNVKIASGPGNAMWFHDRGDNTVGFVSPSGAVQSFAFTTPDTAGGFSSAGHLAPGPDGNMWVGHSAALARVTPSGTITEYPVPGAGFIAGVAAGADGNIWFTDHANSKLGRLLVSSATNSGTATIDQGTTISSPAELYAITKSTGSSRLTPNAATSCPGGTFLLHSDSTPPPHIIVIDLPPTACADLALQFDGAVAAGLRFLFIGFEAELDATITNNGPNPATPQVTLTATSTDGGADFGKIIVNGSSQNCSIAAGSIARSAVLTCVSDQQIAPGSTGRVEIHTSNVSRFITMSGAVSSVLPDQVPTNNTASGTFDIGLGTVSTLPADAQPVAAPVKRH